MALRLASWTLKGKARALCPTIHEVQQKLTVNRSSRHNSTTASASTYSPSSLAGPSVAPTRPRDADSFAVDSTQTALSLLRSQPTHYVVASIAGRTLLMHPRDLITIPRLNDVEIGDVLELDRIHEVGSRDYTLRAQSPMESRVQRDVASKSSTMSHQARLLARLQRVVDDDDVDLDELRHSNGDVKESQSWAAKLKPGGLAHGGAVLGQDTVRVRCTVVEHTKGRMEFIVKKKRRKGYKKTIQHKPTYTRLRVEGIELGQ